MPEEQDDARALPEEAQEHLNLDQPGGELAEGEEAERNGQKTHGEKGDVREGLGGVEPREDLEELAVPGGRKGNARVPEDHRVE